MPNLKFSEPSPLVESTEQALPFVRCSPCILLDLDDVAVCP